MGYIIKLIGFLFNEIKTNTGLVAIISSILTLVLTKLADYFFVKKNAEMEIRKLLVGKSIEAHEEIIQYMNASRAVNSPEISGANRCPTVMSTLEQFDNFHLGVIKIKAVYSHLLDKKLVEEIDKLHDYSQSILVISNQVNEFSDKDMKKLGIELRGELFERLSVVQELAEKFLREDVWKLKWNSYKTLPRPYYINDTPGIRGTKLQTIYNEYLSNQVLKSSTHVN